MVAGRFLAAAVGAGAATVTGRVVVLADLKEGHELGLVWVKWQDQLLRQYA